jgi:hypothetical protein
VTQREARVAHQHFQRPLVLRKRAEVIIELEAGDCCASASIQLAETDAELTAPESAMTYEYVRAWL